MSAFRDQPVVQAFWIPPQINPGIAGSPLSDIYFQKVHLGDKSDTRAYREAVDSASEEELELARPQIFFILRDLKDRLLKFASRIDPEIQSCKTPTEIAENILHGVSVDALHLLDSCDRQPRNKRQLSQLKGVAVYLAEISLFAAAISEKDGNFSNVADQALPAFDGVARSIDKFRSATKDRYPEVSSILPSSAEILEEARRRIASATYSVPRLSPERLETTSGLCGSHDILWDIASGRQRQEYIDKGRYRPLQGKEASVLREEVSSLLNDFDDVFHSEGFVAELRQIVAAQQYSGLLALKHANERTEASIRRERKSIYHTRKEHEARIEEAVRRLPKERKWAKERASNALASANMLSGFLADAGRLLSEKATKEARIEFVPTEGAIVGQLDVPHDYAIVIYDDHVVRDLHPEAVYAVKMPIAELTNGVPPLEEVREAKFGVATNYRHIEECLAELGNRTERSYFFDGIVIVGHNGFDLIKGTVTSETKENDQDSVPEIAF